MPRSAIIGTAGHIDHGKTQLIRLLTGVDTDRLKEEKKRGISIELGFTSLELPSGRRTGVVDVPGHERFIRNMLAGAGGIDLILFVIAADEGIMPQTREHLDIVQLLGVTDGVVALTKVDLVDEDWLDLVESEIHDFLAPTPLAEAPILRVSSVTGEGRDELRQVLDSALDAWEARERGRFTRLPIDRVFTMEGFGTVTTGTLWGGRLREGDVVRILPGDQTSRVKSLEVHNEHVPEAIAGQRVAVNLHNVTKTAIERGMWLVLEPDLRPVQKIDARVHAVRELRRPIADRMRIRFYLGAAEVMGRIVLLEREELGAGEDGLAQIQLEEPTVVERGDRFVLRHYSPMFTIGGGLVIDVSETRRRRYRKEDLEALRRAEEGTLEDRVAETVASERGSGLPEGELPQRLGQPPAELAAALETLLQQGQVLRVGKSRLVSLREYEEAGRLLEAAILAHEREHPLRYGPSKSELKSRFRKTLHADVAEAWIQSELAGERLFARGDLLRRSGESVPLTPAREQLRDRLVADLESCGFAGPTQKEFLERHTGSRDSAEMLQLLLAESQVVRLPGEILVHASFIEILRSRLLEYFTSNEDLSVASLKDLLGVSRKQGVPYLEFADSRQWTMRKQDVRVRGSRLVEPGG